MKKILILGYLLSLHLLIIIAFVKTDLLSQLYHFLKPLKKPESSYIEIIQQSQWQMDTSIHQGASIFFGDSLTAAMPCQQVIDYAVNFGINGLRSDQLLTALPHYHSLARAVRIFLTIGTNDLLQSRSEGLASRYQSLLKQLPSDIPIIMSSIPPLGANFNDIIKVELQLEVVKIAELACKQHANCIFVDIYHAMTANGKVLPGILVADDIHLANKGYQIWIDLLKSAVISSGKTT